MPGLTPTAAAMRFAKQCGRGEVMAKNLDHATGLPELIAALECYVANDARSPMRVKAEAALAIAREGRK